MNQQDQNQPHDQAYPSTATVPNPYADPSSLANYPVKDGQFGPPPPPPPDKTISKGHGFWRGFCSGLCCYCCLDACF
ncbi:Cysteine-rich/transmembrane domain A-like protein [Melia azedarach]|uniref:Cysteine-rich/transmembrane domain A-like protein n=1 Tax=Melia azedarach TaxID=155640 RepID=A0ACC1XRE4_MELAZ|nr:Cysteine-rich/transmembrane domain A-like protein [Melia azedarach]